MMARYIIVVLSVIALAVELVSCCSSGGGGGIQIPRTNSGRPFGVDINDNAEVYPYYKDGVVGVGAEIRFRRRRSTEGAFVDEDTSRMLFAIFDLNQDGKIDVVDWTTEGGKLVSFSDLIKASDIDGDDKVSLEEFLQVPVSPNLGLSLHGLGHDDDTQGGEGTPSPAQY